jgi:hypothetical protein
MEEIRMKIEEIKKDQVMEVATEVLSEDRLSLLVFTGS